MFDYRITKDGKVFISWNNRPVVTLAGPKAASFVEQIDGLDEADAQLLLARVTGNFRRGNEHLAKQKAADRRRPA